MVTSFGNALGGSLAAGGGPPTAASVARNRDPILAVLRDVLPARGTVLEIAAGTGEHAVFFAAALPGLSWQPTDPDPQARSSIAAHAQIAGLTNLQPALELDASSPEWPVERADAVVSINMIHIAPWTATQGLIAGAGRILPVGAPLYLYGPYRVNGEHTAPSNAGFDQVLRSHNPEWGVRDLEQVVALAAEHALALERTVAMPANNLSVIFVRNP